MSEARAITNFIGNTVATLVIARWNHEFDLTKAGAILSRPESTVSTPAPDPPQD
jgi:aerobic C4-dicarboxylate transport protein